MPGYLDTHGIYIYAEDDDFDAFSDVLNVGQEATSDAIGLLKGRATSTEAELGKRIRMYAIKEGEDQSTYFPTPATFEQRLALQRSGAILHYFSNGRLYKFWAENDSGAGISYNPEGRTPYGWYPLDDKQTGYFNANSDADGLCEVAHNLGTAPFVFVTHLDSGALPAQTMLTIHERTDESFTIKATRSDTGAAIATANIKFHWMAVVPDFNP